MGLGIEPTNSWILVGFVSTEPQQELLDALPTIEDSHSYCSYMYFHSSGGKIRKKKTLKLLYVGGNTTIKENNSG